MLVKEKILVYGAGSGGRKYYSNQDQYDIIAFIDKDEKKQGDFLYELEIISPMTIESYIKDKKINKIVIASMFYKEIVKELTEKHLIDRDLIIGAPKRFLVDRAITFENKEKYDYSKRILTYFLELFNESKIKYYLDFGTLLGFKRDGDFIPWDDDIDFSIQREDMEKLIDFLSLNLDKINEFLRGNWTISTVKDKKHKIVEVKLEPTLYVDDEKYVSVDIYVWDVEGEEIYNRVNSASIKHFQGYEILNVFGVNARVYHEVDGYLTSTYGDWKTPNPNMSFGQHNDIGRFNSDDIGKEYREPLK